MAGCGLGSMIIKSNTMLPQVTAASTNSSSNSQGFGITSGTSNCLDSSDLALLRTQREFVKNNLNMILKESAQGQGETLSALAEVFQCSKDAYGTFAGILKQNHERIFRTPGSEAVFYEISEVVRQGLGSQCRVVG